MQTLSITDPTYIGPGCWYLIHLTAKQAAITKNYASKRQFIALMEDLKNNFPCLLCRSHIQQYMKSHPFEEYISEIYKGKDIGLFRWSVDFHNAVNKRIKKQLVPWETAFSLYFEDTDGIAVCTTNCGH